MIQVGIDQKTVNQPRVLRAIESTILPHKSVCFKWIRDVLNIAINWPICVDELCEACNTPTSEQERKREREKVQVRSGCMLLIYHCSGSFVGADGIHSYSWTFTYRMCDMCETKCMCNWIWIFLLKRKLKSCNIKIKDSITLYVWSNTAPKKYRRVILMSSELISTS